MKRVSNFARFAAIRTSQPSAMFMPAPTAAPLTAAIVGSGRARDAQEPFVDGAKPGSVARAAEVAEVGARAERRRRARDDDRADVLVGFDVVHRRDDLVDHREGERVSAVGIVERERRDTISDVDMHEGHAGSLSP